MIRSGCISALVLFFIIVESVVLIGVSGRLLAASNEEKPSLTAELVQAAHRVLDLGYDCAKSGAVRAACHAQLTTAIKNRVK